MEDDGWIDISAPDDGWDVELNLFVEPSSPYRYRYRRRAVKATLRTAPPWIDGQPPSGPNAKRYGSGNGDR